MSKGVTIYFMRHGETYLNRYNHMQGWADAPLTPHGISDVTRSAKGLANVRFSAVYTSDLSRTGKTAKIVMANNMASDSSIKIRPRKAFREQFFGSFEGLEAEPVWEEMSNYVHEHYPDVTNSSNEAVKVEMDAFHAIDPTHDAENFISFWDRIEKGLIEVIEEWRETDENVLVVSHGMTIRNMIHELIPDFELGNFLDNASVSIVRYQDGAYHLDAFNQTDHFAIQEAVEQSDDEKAENEY